MSQAGARRRDVLVLLVLGLVIAGGLVHYGRDKVGDPAETATHADSVTQPSPTAQATAQLESAPPADPATAPTEPAKTCWDGRATSSLRVCGLPEGARGLSWVFPSFARDRAECHQADANPESYPVIESYECFQRAEGQPVTITYDHVHDPDQVARWLRARLGSGTVRKVPGPNGGRLVFADAGGRTARVTGTYKRFPYVVSVYAATPRATQHAWERIVQRRDETEIRGVVAG